MKWLLLFVLLITTSAQAFHPHELAAEPSNMFRAPHCAITLDLPIYQLIAQNTGADDPQQVARSTVTLVGKNTWVTTAHSVLDGEADKITIYTPNITEISATIRWVDVAKDIAILTADSGDITPMAGMSSPIVQWEQVWTIGYAGIRPEYLISFTGAFVRYTTDGLIVANSIALNGMSGGPLMRCVDGKPELFGIITNLFQHAIKHVQYLEGGVLYDFKLVTNNGISLSTPVLLKKK